MTIAPESTLADVVTSHPSLAREFEALGLDYCCGGKQTVAAACADQGLDPRTVVAALVDAARDRPPADWASMDAAELVEHLESTHHAYLWTEMPRVSELLDTVVGVHGERHPELFEIRAWWAEIRADLEPHLHKEERVLFPMIRTLAESEVVPEFHCGTLRNPIAVMWREHDSLAVLFARVRALTAGYVPPADACTTYRIAFAALADVEADTHMHIHKENNVLFPEVTALEQRRSRLGA